MRWEGECLWVRLFVTKAVDSGVFLCWHPHRDWEHLLWTVLSTVVYLTSFCDRLTFILNQKQDQVGSILRYFSLFTRYRLRDLVKLMMWENIDMWNPVSFPSQFVSNADRSFLIHNRLFFPLGPQETWFLIQTISWSPRYKIHELATFSLYTFSQPFIWVLGPGPLACKCVLLTYRLPFLCNESSPCINIQHL